MISYDGATPMTVEEFIAECERLLTPEDYADARITFGLDKGVVKNRVFRRWQRFDEALKNEMVWTRAHQRQMNPANVLRGEREFDGEIAQTLAQAGRTENLMEAEKMLMRLQWQRLDEITAQNLFSLDVILAYGVKLKILERLAAFRTEDGSKMLEEIAAQSVERRGV